MPKTSSGDASVVERWRMDENELSLLDDLLLLESGLTDWEMDFIQDLDAKRERALTAAQHGKLEQIAEDRL